MENYIINRIYDLADVRCLCLRLLGTGLLYELPINLEVTYIKNNEVTHANLVGIKRNSLKSRPRLIYDNGSVIELSHCLPRDLVSAFKGLVQHINEQADIANKQAFIESLIPYIGRDLHEELVCAGFEAGIPKVTGRYRVLKTINISEIKELSMEELAGISEEVNAIESVLKLSEWTQSVKYTYRELSASDKAKYHQFKFLKTGFDYSSVHKILRDLWSETSMFVSDVPIINSSTCIYEKDLERLSDYLIMNNYKMLYICEQSTATLGIMYNLFNNGWILSSTTLLKATYGGEYKTLVFTHN